MPFGHDGQGGLREAVAIRGQQKLLYCWDSVPVFAHVLCFVFVVDAYSM